MQVSRFALECLSLSAIDRQISDLHVVLLFCLIKGNEDIFLKNESAVCLTVLMQHCYQNSFRKGRAQVLVEKGMSAQNYWL